MNTVEFAIRDGVPYAIDYMNSAPDFDVCRSVSPLCVGRPQKLVIDVALSEREEPELRRGVSLREPMMHYRVRIDPRARQLELDVGARARRSRGSRAARADLGARRVRVHEVRPRRVRRSRRRRRRPARPVVRREGMSGLAIDVGPCLHARRPRARRRRTRRGVSSSGDLRVGCDRSRHALPRSTRPPGAVPRFGDGAARLGDPSAERRPRGRRRHLRALELRRARRQPHRRRDVRALHRTLRGVTFHHVFMGVRWASSARSSTSSIRSWP